GLTALLRDGLLIERLALWQVRVTDPEMIVAPAALALTGLGWAVLSLALHAERRRLLVTGGWIGSAAALSGAMAVAALPVASVLRHGLGLTPVRPFLVAAVLLVVAALVPWLAVRSARTM